VLFRRVFIAGNMNPANFEITMMPSRVPAWLRANPPAAQHAVAVGLFGSLFP